MSQTIIFIIIIIVLNMGSSGYSKKNIATLDKKQQEDVTNLLMRIDIVCLLLGIICYILYLIPNNPLYTIHPAMQHLFGLTMVIISFLFSVISKVVITFYYKKRNGR